MNMKKIVNYIPAMLFTAVLITEIVTKASNDIITATIIAGMFDIVWS